MGVRDIMNLINSLNEENVGLKKENEQLRKDNEKLVKNLNDCEEFRLWILSHVEKLL